MGSTRTDSRRTGWLASAVVAVALLFAAPAALASTTRFAMPDGTTFSSTCTSPGADCSIQHANDVADPGDELIITSGTYDFGSSPGPVLDKPLTVHGEDGRARPLLTNNTSGGSWTLLDEADNGASLRYVAIEQKGAATGLFITGASTGPDVHVQNVTAIARGAGATAIDGTGSGLLDFYDSTAFAPGAGATAFANSTTFDGEDITAIAPGSGGIGFEERCAPGGFSGCHSDSSAFIYNMIVDGGPSGGADIKTRTGACDATCTTYHTSVSATRSNYDDVSDCTGCGITPPGTLENQTSPPKLVDAANGDFRELPGSPTIDAGGPFVNDFVRGDPDGNPRTLGPAADIGAFEASGTPVVSTLPASNIGLTTARLNSTVDARGFATSAFFQWGTTTAYGNQVPPAPSPIGSNTSPVPVFADVGGLPAGTLIHYRVVASNSHGTAFGNDQTFRTGAAPASLASFTGIRLSVLVFKVKGKFVVVAIPCPPTVVGNCVGTILLQTAKPVAKPKLATAARKKHKTKKKRLTLGKASFSIPSGQSKNVKIKLSSAALKLLKRGSLKSLATITATANGQTVKTSQQVTLKPAAKKKKKKH